LYRELIAPIEDKFIESPNRVIIIPDGPLATLPVEAFITSAGTNASGYWELDYLCRKYIVNYAYSLSILQKNLEHQQKTDSPRLLALSYSSQLDTDADVELQRSENELPYSAEEILDIKKIMDAKCFLGNDATETRFKMFAPKYSMIHLALHGKADTTDMFNSRLIFKRDSTEKEDGELRAFELYDMDLSKLQLVVLSACETGLGEVHEGEGIFSIARGFAYAGCPSIVMSLWKVNDKTTADLVDFFYKNLRQGQPKDAALRNAKLSFLQSADDLSAHPANWAAFIALGNNSPVQLPAANYPWVVFAIAASLLGGGYWGMRKYLRKT
jgi:CHAT domain-containing protein